MNITTYHSEDAPSHKSWLAYMDLGICHMDFFADTKLKAVEKAERFFAAEKARQVQIVGNIKDKVIEPTETNPWDKIDWGNPSRGQGFLGKVWMLNRATGQRARVNASEVEGYIVTGYIVAGPRSK